jgi:BASS family bile acid:Na+ symporter
VKQAVDIAIPAITFALLMSVGLDLTRADFVRVRRSPAIVAAGLLVPILVLPLVALGLIWSVRPSPAVEAGLLLIAVCPIGGISNTYTYLARASTALSVTLTGLSCLLAVVTIPLLTSEFERVLSRPLDFSAPASFLFLQLALMLALPVGLGMAVRRRWPAFAEAGRPLFQRAAFAGLALLIVFVITSEAGQFLAGLRTTVPLSAAFVVISFAAGWLTAGAIGASAADRFTLSSEFATRNVAIATAISVTLLGRVDYAVFATTYFLTELPLMLAAIALWRRWKPG